MSYQISLPFSFDPIYGGLNTTSDDQKTWQDRVVIVVMTLFSERVMMPSYGSTAREAVFENYTDIPPFLENSISLAFSKWLPELTFTGLEASTDSDGYLNMTVHYKYGATPPTSVIIKTAQLTQSGDIISEA